MSKYSVDLRKFAAELLPFALRGNVMALLRVLTHPARVLHHRFMEFRGGALWRLSYNACVGSMQAMLNDRFGDILAGVSPAREILVDDGQSVPSLMVYPEAEHAPLVLGCVMLTSHTAWGSVPFVVQIPDDFEDDTDLRNAVEALVRQYKLSGTNFTIVHY